MNLFNVLKVNWSDDDMLFFWKRETLNVWEIVRKEKGLDYLKKLIEIIKENF